MSKMAMKHHLLEEGLKGYLYKR